MANLQTTFDPNAVEPRQGELDPVPAGEYVAQIVESDVAAAKSGNGLLLNLTWEILEGDYANRKFWDRINYQHTSAQAQLIGQQHLKSICDAIGLNGHIEDSEALHFQPCRVRVLIDDKDKNYASKNVVKSVKPLAAALPDAKAAPQAPVKTAATKPAAPTKATAPAAGTRPWGNRATAAPQR